MAELNPTDEVFRPRKKLGPQKRKVNPEDHTEVQLSREEYKTELEKARIEGEKVGVKRAQEASMSDLRREVCKLLSSGDLESARILIPVLVQAGARVHGGPAKGMEAVTSFVDFESIKEDLRKVQVHISEWHYEQSAHNLPPDLDIQAIKTPDCVKVVQNFGKHHFALCKQKKCEQLIKIIEQMFFA